MSQTSYSQTPSAGLPGLISDSALTDKISRKAVGDMPFGRMVSPLTADSATLAGNTDTGALGVTIRSLALATSSTSVDDRYLDKDVASIMRRGRIWVETTGDDPEIGSPVVIRIDGRAQVTLVTFSAAFVTDNVITLKVNNSSLTTVPFNTNTNTTLQDVADQILADFPTLVDTVDVDTGARSLSITASGMEPEDDITVTEVLVAAGASQATATVTEPVSSLSAQYKGAFQIDDEDTGGTIDLGTTSGFEWTGDVGEYNGVQIAELNINLPA